MITANGISAVHDQRGELATTQRRLDKRPLEHIAERRHDHHHDRDRPRERHVRGGDDPGPM
jgi:hypothetical protein